MLETKLSKNIAFPLSHQLIEILRDVILKNNYRAVQSFFTEKELPYKLIEPQEERRYASSQTESLLVGV